MVDLDKTFNGKKWEKGLAEYGPVQREIDDHTGDVARAAAGLLAQHKHDGHAEIQTSKGRIDGHVVLSDERGLKAALSIEYGRQPDDDGRGGMDGLFILHRAAGLPVRARGRRR